jgi:hypothetical protein
VVRVQLSEGSTYVKQLTAGDGFLSGNERVLTFGLGDATRIETLHVRWPSGTEQTWKELTLDQEIVIVENGKVTRIGR